MHWKVVLIFVCFCHFCGSITNNADLIWYDGTDPTPHEYHARESVPPGLVASTKIIVNQKLPLLWEVKFAFFDNLQVLILDDCGVAEIRPYTFKDLKPLRNLSLAKNHLRHIAEDVFNRVQITNLDLSHNRISTISSKAFDNIPVLECIILDYNELLQWNSLWFYDCTNLQYLSATHNFIEELPEKSFKNINNTDLILRFGYNKIKNIHTNALGDSGYFREFSLRYNELVKLEKINRISGRFMDLQGNDLKCLDEVFLDGLEGRIEILDLRANLLDCNCTGMLTERNITMLVDC